MGWRNIQVEGQMISWAVMGWVRAGGGKERRTEMKEKQGC